MTLPRPGDGAPPGADPVPLARLTLRARMGLALLAGGIGATGQAPWGLWPLTILALAAVHALTLAESRPARTAAIWWAAGTGYFALALSWIVEPFLVDIARDGWMAPFAMVLMATGMALFWGLAGDLARRITGGGGAAFAASVTLMLVLAGVLRGVIFTGFPWALPAHVLIGTPAMQLAQWGGAIGLGLIVVGLATTLPLALHRPRRLPLWLAAAAAPFAAGHLLTPPPADTTGRPVIRLVQPNVPQRDKWNPALAPLHYQRLLDLTATPGEPDLIVWPETALPAWLEDVTYLTPDLSEAARDTPLVFGINRSGGDRIYNSLVLLGQGGEITEVYDKHHLVPFGEYTPAGDLLGRIGIQGLAQRDGHGFSPGPGARLIDIPGLGPALPLICYEGVFPRDIAAAPGRPALLLLITNDAWFGTVSGPYQHLAQARLRAVEQGLPMVRVANTGISVVIDPAGRLTGRIDLGETGMRDVPLPPARTATPYARIGGTPLTLLLLAAQGALILRARRTGRRFRR